MKPSEFWAQIFALPEQARQAEGEAGELRIRADALCGWARLAISVHRSAIDDADVGGIEEGKKHLDALPPYPDVAMVGSPAVETATLPERTRKQRSDAGKPRGRKTDESAPANPGDVKAEDAARVKLAGQIRLLLAAEPGPQSLTWIAAHLESPTTPDEIRDAIKLLSLVSWRMRRDGDSQPVEVWGTYKQLGEHLAVLRSCPDGRAGCEVMHAGWHPDDNMLGAIVNVAPSDVFLATKAAAG